MSGREQSAPAVVEFAVGPDASVGANLITWSPRRTHALGKGAHEYAYAREGKRWERVWGRKRLFGLWAVWGCETTRGAHTVYARPAVL